MSSELRPNLIALNTIVYREVRRFMRIWPQTLLPPAITMVCLLYTSPSPRDQRGSRMPSSA